MESSRESKLEQMSHKFHKLSDEVKDLAKGVSGDSLALLALLRTLEGLHREICEGLFQESLPNNRRALYSLLKDIEAQGGWPYIHRMRLHSFLDGLAEAGLNEDSSTVDRESETKL